MTGEVPPPPASNAQARPEEKPEAKPVDIPSVSHLFDEAAFASALQACTDVDRLDLAMDEVRDFPPGDLMDRIREVYVARRRALG